MEFLVLKKQSSKSKMKETNYSTSFAETPYQILPLVQPSPGGGLVNTLVIRRICAAGLSECPNEDRALAWLILLGIYPRNAIEWPEIKYQIVHDYKNYVKDICQLQDWHKILLPKNPTQSHFDVNDKNLMFIIHTDISRTTRQICFFPPTNPISGSDPKDIFSPFLEHSRRMERILYVFGIVNHSLYYMQGFNELLSPLYFALCKAQSIFKNLDEVEALSFRCLQELLTATSLSEFYTTQDQSSILFHKLSGFSILLNEKLPDISKILNNYDIQPLQYCYRWFNILFAQQHDLPTLLIVWDSLFAHIDDLIQYLFYVAIAHIRAISPNLDPDDYPGLISKLQDPKITNIYTVLKDATEMYNKDHNIYDAASKYRNIKNQKMV